MEGPSEAQQLLARLKERSETRANKDEKRKDPGASLNLAQAVRNAAVAEEGEPDSTTIITGMKIVLRGLGGSCLSVVDEDSSDHPREGAASRPARYLGAAEGHGFGDVHECMTLHNRHARKIGIGGAELPVRYGDKIMVRSRHARERCLAPRGSAEALVFERNLGTGADLEDWELLPAATSPTDRAGFDETQSARRIASASGRSLGALAVPTLVGLDGDEKRPKGGFLRAGDRIAMRNCSTGKLLVLRAAYEGEGGSNGAPRLSTALEGQASTEAATWHVVVAGTPFLPPWTVQRAYLTGRFLLKPQRGKPPLRVVEALFGSQSSEIAAGPPALRTLPVALQEQLVLDDLLSACMGLEGKYIKMVPRAPLVTLAGPFAGLGDAAFVLEAGSIDRSLASLTERMLPMGGALVAVKAFIEAKSRHEHGLVAHALASAVKVLVKEYLVLVAQLEHQHRQERLTLQKLWFFVQPALHTMILLRDVCATAGTSSGGCLLNVLFTKADRGGDEKSTELHAFLLARAAAPYLDMLRRWVYEGVLDDPYHEFMVAEDETVTKETVAEDFTTAYWERRYTLRRRHVAVLLGRFVDKILTTGKYLNVVRECGRDIRCPDSYAAGALGNGDRGVLLGEGEAAYGEVVERAFAFASSTLLALLLGERQLVERLRSMKHYFLLDQGDLYVNFMDLAEDELGQDMRLVSKTRIEALLQLAVQSSVANRDTFKDDLTCAFAPYSMIQHLELIHSKDGHASAESVAAKTSGTPPASLKGIEVFMLDYCVSWPVSLVVSKRSVTKYQLVFRHLFFARHVERCLKATWQGHQHLKELDVRAAGGRSYCLRHRMLGFMQNIVYYFTYEVIEPRWHEMEHRLKQSRTMDDVLAAHAELQDTILKECLLTNQELLKTLTKIMTICLLFTEQVICIVPL